MTAQPSPGTPPLLVTLDGSASSDPDGNLPLIYQWTFGEGNLDFDELMPAIVAAGCPDDWWTIDLCFWPDAWSATETCKKFVDGLANRYGR